MGGAEQLPSRRDLDLSHTEASHAGADAGHQGNADHSGRLEAPEEREPAEESQMGTGDTIPDKEAWRDLHLVGRRTIKLQHKKTVL